MKTLLAAALLLASTSVHAAGPCEGHAKFGAIRAYRAASGTIQGSNPTWSARHVRARGLVNDYVVTIADSNEDNESWEIDYAVSVRGKKPHCSVVSVKKIATR